MAKKSNQLLSEFRRNFLSSLATEFIPWRPGKTVWLLVLLLISLTVAKPAGADRVNLPLQGFVIDSETERPLSRTMQVTFTVYSDCDADESFWSVTKFVEFIGGYYSVGLDIPDNVFSLSDDLCLGIQIGDDEELTPRLEFFSTPFAKRSNRADSAELADLAETALNLASDNLPNLAGSGLTTSGDALSLDTSDSQIWTGTQTYSAQVIVSRVPQDGFSSSASLRVNPVITTSDAANRKFFAIQDNGTDRFTVDKEGDVTIAGNLTVTGTATIGSLGDITSVTAGSGL